MYWPTAEMEIGPQANLSPGGAMYVDVVACFARKERVGRDVK